MNLSHRGHQLPYSSIEIAEEFLQIYYKSLTGRNIEENEMFSWLFGSCKRKSEAISMSSRKSSSSNSLSPRKRTRLSYSSTTQPFDELPHRDFCNPFRSSGAAEGVSAMSSRYIFDKKEKYAFIPDNFTSVDQVTTSLRESGLESSNLIVGFDFTRSNEWTGKHSFNNRSLHALGDTPNPYETAISIIGKTLSPFDEDNLIPCFGFGDANTHDREVFNFHSDGSPCHGFEEVLACYKRIVPHLRLSGPTSYAPVVDAAVDMVEKSGGQYHVLVVVADGQVSSEQEEKTIKSIVNASQHPLSIVLVGVGDGPWDDMKKFDDRIPSREFDNFQFVNFTSIMSKRTSPSEKETAFALAALMEIPIQYKAASELGILGRVTGKAKKVIPRPPPVPYTPVAVPSIGSTTTSAVAREEQKQICPVCMTNPKDTAFGCGHMTCRECSSRLTDCPVCRQRITNRLGLYT